MKKNYITKKTFEKIKDEKFNLLIGANLITITNIQLNFHKINSPTYPHYHPDAQLLYYLKGSGIEEIDGKKFNIVPGSFVFIPSYKKHAFFPYKETTAEIFTMRFEAKKNIIKNSDSSLLSKGFFKILKLFYGKKPDVWTVKEDRKNEVENLIKKIDENLSEKKFGYIISIEGYLLLLINEFLTSYLERREIVEKKASKKEIIFKKVVNFITENIEKQVTIKEIAKNYYFSVNYIQKIIKEFTGRSFTRFMHDIKIEYVKELLKNTTLEIKEIAGRCGFYDQNYFTRIFKKIEGIPPSKYREI